MTLPCSVPHPVNVLHTLPQALTVAPVYRRHPEAPDDKPFALLWPDPRRGPWLLVLEWAPVHGRMECVGMELRSCRLPGEDWPSELPGWDQNPPVLTSRVLRELRLGEVLHDLRQAQADATLDWTSTFNEDTAEDRAVRESVRRLAAAWAEEPGATEGQAEVARVYLNAWRAGRPPTKAVQEHFTISYSAAAKRVSRARQAGLLPETRRGRAGAGGKE